MVVWGRERQAPAEGERGAQGGRGWDHMGSWFGVRPMVLVPGPGVQEIPA